MTVRDRIMQIFEETRQTPGAPVPEPHFMEGLVRPGRASLDNSFRGKSRKVRFLDAVEREFAICLLDADREKRWKLEDFAQHVEDLSAKTALNIKRTTLRLEKARAPEVVPLAICLAIAAPVAWAAPSFWKLFALVPCAVCLQILRLRARDISHCKALLAKLGAAADGDR
jgi:hypothetical protein